MSSTFFQFFELALYYHYSTFVKYKARWEGFIRYLEKLFEYTTSLTFFKNSSYTPFISFELICYSKFLYDCLYNL